MRTRTNRTKIVATIGPASASSDILKQMVQAGMTVARLNFSHGSYDDHAQTVKRLRAISAELQTPITILQDLQGPKIRVGKLASETHELIEGEIVSLVPLGDDAPSREIPQNDAIPIDYPYLAEEAQPGMQILLDDGLLELKVHSVSGTTVQCQVVEGGLLKSRKGVNLPDLNLQLPSLTEKDKQDLAFGIAQGVDWVSLSFVREAADIEVLKALLAEQGAADMPVIAKIEKPQAIENLEAILEISDGVMVARGDLGVEMSPERVPLLQKQIIRACNLRSLPVITATQMLESMITNPRPTRAEASDVANAIMDGTDAVMLSGEAAVGQYPVKAVQMLAKIAADVEPEIQYATNPPLTADHTHVLGEALNTIDKVTALAWIVTFTSSGYTAMIAAGERPRAAVAALTPNLEVYHRLNLVWGVIPIFIQDQQVTSFECLVALAQSTLLEQHLVELGDRVLIMGGIPPHRSRGTNFIKLHQIEEDI